MAGSRKAVIEKYVSCVSSLVTVQTAISQQNRIASREKFNNSKKTRGIPYRKKIIQKIMENPADLSEFKEHPLPRLIVGLFLMALSFIMGWPTAAALSVMDICFQGTAYLRHRRSDDLRSFLCSFHCRSRDVACSSLPEYSVKYTLQSFLKKIL
jgi:hypothetical protein